MQPSSRSRNSIGPLWKRFEAGDAYASILDDESLFKKPQVLRHRLREAMEPQPVISRSSLCPENYSGCSEEYVPERFLSGLIPDGLLMSYRFWQEAAELSSPKNGVVCVLRGYPKAPNESSFLIFVEVDDSNGCRVERVPMTFARAVHLLTVELITEVGLASDFAGDGSAGTLEVLMDELYGGMRGLLLNLRHRLLMAQGPEQDAPDALLRRIVLDAIQSIKKNGASAVQGRREGASYMFAAMVEHLKKFEPRSADASSETQEPPLILTDVRVQCLQDLLRSRQGTELHGFARAMIRMENLSYVMCWRDVAASHYLALQGTSVSGGDGPLVFELRRLHLTFEEKTVEQRLPSGVEASRRLYCLDHTGFFVDDNGFDDAIAAFFAAVPWATLLTNDNHEKRLLVPLIEARRPDIHEMPYSTHLVQVRKPGRRWRENVKTGHFLYNISVSGSIIKTPTSASALYLLVLKFLHRDYKQVFKLSNAAASDLEVSPEESAILDLLEAVNSDSHPDAFACKLKLSLTMKDRKSLELPWQIVEELAAYLLRRSHVSYECRLTREEEDELFDMLMQSDATRTLLTTGESTESNEVLLTEYELAVLRNRQMQIGALTPGDRSSSAATVAFVVPNSASVPPFSKVDDAGGLDELLSNRQLFAARLNTEAINLSSEEWQKYVKTVGIKYVGASNLQGANLLDAVHELHVARENMHGERCGKGFLFLYEALLGTKQHFHRERDVSKTAAQLAFKAYAYEDLETSPLASIIDIIVKVPEVAARLPFFNDSRSKQKRKDPVIHGREPPLLDLLCEIHEALTSPKLRGLVQKKNSQFQEAADRIFTELRSLCPSQRSLRDRRSLSIRAADARSWICLQTTDMAADTQQVALADFRKFAGLTARQAKHLLEEPLAILGGEEGESTYARLYTRAELEAQSASVGKMLGFSLSESMLRSTYARTYMDKLVADQAVWHSQYTVQKLPQMSCIVDIGVRQLLSGANTSAAQKSLRVAAQTLRQLGEDLKRVRENDQRTIMVASDLLIARGGSVDTSIKDGSNVMSDNQLTETQYLLRKFSGQEAEITIEVVYAALLSTKSAADLRTLNPFLDDEALKELLHLSTVLLCTSNRIPQVNRCLNCVADLSELIRRYLDSFEGSKGTREELGALLVQKAAFLAESLLAKRSYIRRLPRQPKTTQNVEDMPVYSVFGAAESSTDASAVEECDGYRFDPRYLVCEFQWEILLRKRQVELISDFCNEVSSGQPSVKQMIMGQGKTTVISPILTVMLPYLADSHNDTAPVCMQVVPKALLEMSRNVLRGTFNSVIRKNVYTLQFEREKGGNMARALSICRAAQQNKGVLIATPTTVKSIFLKLLELLLESREGAAALEVAGELQTAREVLEIFQNTILIMDEVDLVLHPLKSELNFPIGVKKGIDSAPQRWKLPIHLLDLLFAVQDASLPSQPSDTAASLKQEFRSAVADGIASNALQEMPHLVLLDPEFYQRRLRRIFRDWALLWLSVQPLGLSPKSLQGLLSKAEEGGGFAEADAYEADALKLLKLTRLWLDVYLPHCMGKINRVSFGLLPGSERSSEDIPAGLENLAKNGREVLAVPYVGKDCPSLSSEFAHPDVVIGMTILAYRYQGLRRDHFETIIAELKSDFQQETGPFHLRKSAKLYADWVHGAGGRLKGEEGPEDPDIVDEFNSKPEVLSLRMLKRSNRRQMGCLYGLLKFNPDAICWFLDMLVLPRCMRFQDLKLSACGQELGGDMLFSMRIGFSGTPSDLLPLSLGACGYERGADAKIMSTLTNPEIMSFEVIESGWSPQSILQRIASLPQSAACNALIDTGALITGYSNFETARLLLDFGMKWCQGVVFLDDEDEKKILIRSSGRVVDLDNCGIPLERRFVFYDQIHTTGMDIKHSATATAVLTLGKDMTLRDYFQGAYRMRGIASGQRIRVYITPEMRCRVSPREGTEVPTTSESLTPAAQSPFLWGMLKWLAVQQLHSEELQYQQLRLQSIKDAYRCDALKHLRADASGGALDVFVEGVDYGIHPYVDSEGTALQSVLKQMAGTYPTVIDSSPYAESLKKLLTEVMPTEASSQLDTEVVQEQEQEQEREQEQEQEQEVEAEQSSSPGYSRIHEDEKPWRVDVLTGTGPPPFVPLSDVQMYKGGKLVYPNYVSASRNFLNHDTPMPKRLKNVQVVLEWLGSERVSGDSIRSRDAIMFDEADKEEIGVALSYHNAAERSRPASQRTSNFLQRFLKSATAPGDISRDVETLNFVLNGAGAVVEEAKRYVAVSLREAASLRYVIHTARGDTASDGWGARVCLRTLGSDFAVLDGSEGYFNARKETVKFLGSRSGADPQWQTRVAAAALQVFDGRVQPSHASMVNLLQSPFRTNSPAQRRSFLSSMLGFRRRRRMLSTDASSTRLISYTSFVEPLKMEVLSSLLRKAVSKFDMQEAQFFRTVDIDNDGYLSATELLLALACAFQEAQGAIEVQILELLAKDVVAFLDFHDQDAKRRWTLRDFQSALYFEDTVSEDEEKNPASETMGKSALQCLLKSAEAEATKVVAKALAASKLHDNNARSPGAEVDTTTIKIDMLARGCTVASVSGVVKEKRRRGRSTPLVLTQSSAIRVHSRLSSSGIKWTFTTELQISKLPLTLLQCSSVSKDDSWRVLLDENGLVRHEVLLKTYTDRTVVDDEDSLAMRSARSFLGSAHGKEQPSLPGRQEGGLYASGSRYKVKKASSPKPVAASVPSQAASAGTLQPAAQWKRIEIVLERDSNVCRIRIGSAANAEGLQDAYLAYGTASLLLDSLAAFDEESFALHLLGEPQSEGTGANETTCTVRKCEVVIETVE